MHAYITLHVLNRSESPYPPPHARARLPIFCMKENKKLTTLMLGNAVGLGSLHILLQCKAPYLYP